MTFGIFLFSLKSEFQEQPHFARKVPKNGEKRRKPEKISGFSVGIFFVRCIVINPRNFALCANIRTPSRWWASSPTALAANADRIRLHCDSQCSQMKKWREVRQISIETPSAVRFSCVARPKREGHALRVLLFLEAPPGIGPGIKVLQTSALPLGYGAI